MKIKITYNELTMILDSLEQSSIKLKKDMEETETSLQTEKVKPKRDEGFIRAIQREIADQHKRKRKYEKLIKELQEER